MSLASFLAVIFILIVDFALANLALAKSSQPKHRKDMGSKMTSFVCNDKLRNLDGIFAAKLFDAQIEGQLLTNKFGKPVKTQDLETAAISLAKSLHYHGYTFGACPNGNGFTMATPAPEPLLENKLPLGALRNHCKSWRVDFAQAGLYKPVSLPINGASYESPESNGLVSVTCQPKKPSWLGPKQWYMKPTGKFTTTIPNSLVLDGDKSIKIRFVNWVNKNRGTLGLGALEIKQNLNISADTLSVSNSIAHNRTIIKSVASQLKENGYHFLGENRVKGKDLDQIAKLLWMSPRHRELLLNPKANLIGINIKKLNAEYLAIVVLGETQTSYAKRSSNKGPSVQ